MGETALIISVRWAVRTALKADIGYEVGLGYKKNNTTWMRWMLW